MKKRLIALFLALCIIGTALPLSASAAGVVTKGSAEYKALEDFLAQLAWGIGEFDSQKVLENKSSTPANRNILETLLSPGSGYCYKDALYPGELRQEIWNGSDPLGRWDRDSGYWKTNAQKIDWILGNIFNVSQSDIATLKSSTLNNNDLIYYLDGYYYSWIGGVGGGYHAIITDIQPSGGKYLVKYSVQSVYESEGTPYYAVVGLKSIGGKSYWSLYLNTEQKGGEIPSISNDFVDVNSKAYYYEPVQWAVAQGITNGTGLFTFSPDVSCSKAQILTFIWRAFGEPDPTIRNPFQDVNANDYYYKAALWAYQNGMVADSSFMGNAPCTRSMAVTYLWKAVGTPAVSSNGQFSDVDLNAEYAKAVAWAVNNGITQGTGPDTFSPDDICSRGQIVTLLYRCRNM